MTGPLPPELIRCPNCHAPANRLDQMGATHVRCLECGSEWHRAHLDRGPRAPARQSVPRPRYEIDYEGLAYPSKMWTSFSHAIERPAAKGQDREWINGPMNPLRAVEVLADWQAHERRRARDCGRCMGWQLDEASRPVGAHRPSPGPGGNGEDAQRRGRGTCAGCALSYLDAFDQDGDEIEVLGSRELKPTPCLSRQDYVALQDLKKLPPPDLPSATIHVRGEAISVYTRVEFFNEAAIRPASRIPVTAIFDRAFWSLERGGRRKYSQWSGGGWSEGPGRKPYRLQMA